MASFYFPQFEHEVFWRYYYRLGDFVGFGHGIEQWEMCNVIYDGLNAETRDIVESMYGGMFREQSPEDAWAFIEWLAEDTYNWEMSTTTYPYPNQDPLPSNLEHQFNHTMPHLEPNNDSRESVDEVRNAPHYELTLEDLYQIELKVAAEFPCLSLPPSTLGYSLTDSTEGLYVNDYLPPNNSLYVQIDDDNIEPIFNDLSDKEIEDTHEPDFISTNRIDEKIKLYSCESSTSKVEDAFIECSTANSFDDKWLESDNTESSTTLSHDFPPPRKKFYKFNLGTRS